MILCFLLGGVVISSCKTPAGSQVEVPAGKYLLRPTYQKGEQFKVQWTIHETMKATDSPQGDWTMENQIAQDWDFSVEKTDRSGGAALHGVYRHLVVTYDAGPQGKLTYDSNDEPVQPGDKYFKRMVGKEMDLKMDRMDRVVLVEGADELMAHMFGKKSTYTGNDWMRENLNLTAVFPGQPIGKGDSWKQTVSMTSFYPFVTEWTCVVEEVKDGKMKIGLQGAAAPNPNAQPTSEMGFKMNYALEGDIEGHVWVDLGLGRQLASELNYDLQGTCSLGLPDGTDISFPVTLDKQETARFTY